MEHSFSGSASALLKTQPTFHELLNMLGEAALDDIESQLHIVQLPAGVPLFGQGDSGDSLYFLVSGQLAVVIEHHDGRQTTVDTLCPGVSVGELALLTGQPRGATVYAIEDSVLVQLSGQGYHYLAEHYPQAFSVFATIISARFQRTYLADVLTHLFGELDVTAFHDLQAALEWIHIPRGQTVFQQGERGDAMYIVVNGRLRIVVHDPNGTVRTIGEVSRGECVGEFALLTGAERTATVLALRDTDVVKLTQNLFDRLLQRYPQAMMRIARGIAMRSSQAVGGDVAQASPATTFAILPASPAVPVVDMGYRLANLLSRFGATLCLTSEQVDTLLGKSGIAQTDVDEPANIALRAWLQEQESTYQYIIYIAEPTWSPWTQRCARQADRLLLLAHADTDPAPSRLELGVQQMETSPPIELVLLHPDHRTQPRNTMRWLAPRHLATHHHVRLGSATDLARLSRRLVGRPIGLVLAGGGARGYVHIGAIRALEEAGIPVDIIGGTSMGAVLGGVYANGFDCQHMLETARIMSSRRALLDPTLPWMSFFATRKLTALYRSLFGDVQIEDLWRPYFCVSTNLSQAEPMIHHSGPLWLAVRASTAIPGIFAPVVYNTDLLVDGGVMNNFPLDVMRNFCRGGLVIGVHPSAPNESERRYAFGPSVSGWRMLWTRINPLTDRIQAPSIFTCLLLVTEVNTRYLRKATPFESLADVLIQPTVGQYNILDFDAYEEIVNIGYESAKEHLDALRNHQKLASLWM